MKSAPHIWVSAGEVSGDMHAAAVVREIAHARPEAAFSGIAGPALRAGGVRAVFAMEELSVMGFTEILSRIPRVLTMLRAIKKDMLANRPDAVVVTDAPTFNFHVVKIAYSLGVPVYYYISPKVWATRPGRVRFLKRHVRAVLSILPFESAFYARYGMDVVYTGNPTVDLLARPELTAALPEPGLIGLMPGSRNKEIRALMPILARAARILLRKYPDLRFQCLAAPAMSPNRLRAAWPADIPLVIVPPEERHAAMKSSQLLLAASGTAALESAILGTPTIVTYKVSAFTALIIRTLLAIPYVSLPNIILNRPVFPELLQEKATGENIARAAGHWLAQPEALEPLRRDLAELRSLLGEPGAARRAAHYILNDLDALRAVPRIPPGPDNGP